MLLDRDIQSTAHCAINRSDRHSFMIYACIIYRSIGVCGRHVHQPLGSEPAAFRVTSRNSSKTSRRKHQVISPIRSAPAAYPFRLSLSHGLPAPSPSLLYVPGLLSPPARSSLVVPSPFPAPRTTVRRSGAVASSWIPSPSRAVPIQRRCERTSNWLRILCIRWR